MNRTAKLAVSDLGIWTGTQLKEAFDHRHKLRLLEKCEHRRRLAAEVEAVIGKPEADRNFTVGRGAEEQLVSVGANVFWETLRQFRYDRQSARRIELTAAVGIGGIWMKLFVELGVLR